MDYWLLYIERPRPTTGRPATQASRSAITFFRHVSHTKNSSRLRWLTPSASIAETCRMDTTMRTSCLTIVLLWAAGFAQATEYHVAQDGRNKNTGSKKEPFLTIQRAAELAQPGDVITVHEGLYRERVNPPRGGESDDNRIVYRAAPGEKVVVKGSEIIKSWEKVQGDAWKVVLPNSFFGDFNPYSDPIGGEWYRTPDDGYDRHTGAVYLNDDWLDEAASLEQVLASRNLTAGSRAAPKDAVLGGKTANYPGSAIDGTTEDILYQTCRYNLKGYRLAVPNGTYRVTLKFCEPHFDSTDERVCDIHLRGETVLRGFDIFAKAGKFTAHDETFDGIEVTDGQLKVDFIDRTSMACISGIVIESGDYNKRINCGGPAWKGYQPDPPSSSSDAFAGDQPLWKAEVDEEETTIWAQFEGADPNQELVEINVRQSIFYPDQPGRNYITVRGFTMRQAATPWSGAMSEQIGLIGTHWSKGWIIENNIISHSMNTGITLGRYGLEGVAMPPATASGYVQSIHLALEHGWSKQSIGSHIVRNNHVSHCEKNGIHGSLGGIFSTIEGNTICDIATRGWSNGADRAGLKLLASTDVLIRQNHFYRCGGFGGLWLDWMAQGTRVTANLLHDNKRDIFVEVNHGPLLIDNNLFLSGNALLDVSQGTAYVHNLFAGTVVSKQDARETPYFKPHAVTAMELSNITHKDARYYNNLFFGDCRPPAGDASANLQSAGNVYLEGPGGEVEEKANGVWLRFSQGAAGAAGERPVVTTELLGKAKIPDAPFEQPDGTPYRIDTDYFGEKRSVDAPAPGPFRSGVTGNPPIHWEGWNLSFVNSYLSIIICH